MDDKNLYFSIIIPVYNVEKFLKRCLDSVVHQTLRELEIILINDGSTDSSGELCDAYAKNDSRIKVVHQDNAGLSGARNTGLSHAIGQYVIFLDSDDYIESSTCEQFLEKIKAHPIEIITGQAMQWTDSGQTSINDFSFLPEDIYQKDTFLCNVLAKGFSNVAWINVYNRIFLIENQLFFKEQRLHEDEEWTPRVFLAAQSVYHTHICFYHYIIRQNSISQSRNFKKNAMHYLMTIDELEIIFLSIENPTLRKYLLNGLVTKYLYAFHRAKLWEDGNDYVRKKFVMQYSHGKNKLKSILFCLSPSLYCRLNTASKKR